MPGVSLPSGFSAQLNSLFKSGAGSALGSWMPAIGAGLDAAGGIFGGLFSANQAAKNRKFQERMYYQQLSDNKALLEDARNWSLPSAELQRIKDAGLNPLLYYGQNGSSATLTPAQSAQAPHGAQGNMSMHTNFGQALMQQQLLQAQIRNINADSQLKESEAAESGTRTEGNIIQNEVSRRTKDAMVAIKHKDVEYLNQQIEWLATQDFALTEMTAANLDNIASMIEYRKKYYDLDFKKTHNQIWYNIQEIALGRVKVSNELKSIAVSLYNAKTDRMRVLGELQVFDAQVGEINARKDLTDAQKLTEYRKATNQLIKNLYLQNFYTEGVSGTAGLMLLLSGSLSGRIPDYSNVEDLYKDHGGGASW